MKVKQIIGSEKYNREMMLMREAMQTNSLPSMSSIRRNKENIFEYMFKTIRLKQNSGCVRPIIFQKRDIINLPSLLFGREGPTELEGFEMEPGF